VSHQLKRAEEIARQVVLHMRGVGCSESEIDSFLTTGFSLRYRQFLLLANDMVSQLHRRIKERRAA
jgi:hypothetical protein